MLTVLTNIRSTKVLEYDGHNSQDGHHPITTFYIVHEFGSQISLVKEVIEVDEHGEDNISAAAKKKDKYWMAKLSCATLGIELN